MNFWGFTPAIFGGLDEGFRSFLSFAINDPKAEFYLPAAVSALIAKGAADVHLLPSEDSWFGITYKEDRPQVAAAIASLVARGVYPAPLFG